MLLTWFQNGFCFPVALLCSLIRQMWSVKKTRAATLGTPGVETLSFFGLDVIRPFKISVRDKSFITFVFIIRVLDGHMIH